jgi:S1-C subfamily serine protease/tetratricopeptide (TPR) repeat protein
MDLSREIVWAKACVPHVHRVAIGRLITIASLACGVAGTIECLSARANPPDVTTQQPLSAENLYERIAPSVVTVVVRDEDEKRIGSGSGLCIEESLVSKRYAAFKFDKHFAESQSKNGKPTQCAFILTNYHVIRSAISADINLSSGETGFVSDVLAEDSDADLALVSAFVPIARPQKGIRLSENDPRILATVYAIGSPKGFSGSASEGKVSGYRELTRGRRWLQMTTPISPGSSGGPLLSVDGHLVGVTTITILDAQNINFAVPVSGVRSFLSTAPIKPRAVPSGASIKWHEQTALSAAHKLKEWASTDAERRAYGLIDEARQELQNADDGKYNDAIPHYKHAIDLATVAAKALPDVSKETAHYIIGCAHDRIWWDEAKPNLGEDDFVQAAHMRTRDNPHAIAALSNFVQATELNPNFAPGWWRLSIVYSKRGDWANALSAAEKLVKLLPRSAGALAMRADCHLKRNESDLAIRDTQAAIELSPGNPVLRRQLAEVFTAVGKNAKAVESYKVALNLELEEGRTRKGDATIFDDPTMTFYKLGVAQRKAGNFDDAVSIFTTIKEMGHRPWSDICDEEIAHCKRQER